MRPFFFVHVQKTAGNSIRQALGLPLGQGMKHATAAELRAFHGEERWANAYKFAFVRNPWDRLVSWWIDIDAHRHAPRRNEASFQAYILAHANSFDQFLHCTAEVRRKSIARNQVDYLSPDMDFVGRYERLCEDFRIVAAALERPDLHLPHLNKSGRDRPYWTYYTDASAEHVAMLYARDIAAFGYRFGH